MSKLQIKKLSLQRGDILVIQKGFNTMPNWNKILSEAAKEAGINFSVPVVLVESIDEIAVVRMGQSG